LKRLSKKHYISLSGILKQSNAIKFEFNNSSLNSNIYSFKYLENTSFLDTKQVNLLKYQEISQESLLQSLKGVDNKIEEISKIKYLSLTSSVEENLFYKEQKDKIEGRSNKDDAKTPANSNANIVSNDINGVHSNHTKELSDYGFSTIINNHYHFMMVYSTEMFLKRYMLQTQSQSESNILTNMINGKSTNLVNLLNLFLLQNKDTTGTNNIVDLLSKYIQQIEKIKDLLDLKEQIINKRVLEAQLVKSNILIFLTVLWLASFFFLIYSLYGWDIIEPVTFLSGSILFLLQLVYFLKYKKRIGLEYYFSKSYSRFLFEKFSFEYGYNKNFHSEIAQEINKSRFCRTQLKKELNIAELV